MDPLKPNPEELTRALAEQMRAPRLQLEEPERKPVDWTNTDTMLQAGVGVGMLLDYLQTRQITKAGHEANPIIGKRGERVPPELYFPATFVASLVAAKLLPPEWRHALQGGLIGMQGATVARNWTAAGRNPFKGDR